MSIDSDLAAMLAGWDGQAVTLGDVQGTGLLDLEDRVGIDRGGDPVSVRYTVLRLRRSDFLDTAGALTVTRGDSCIVAGTTYTVSDFLAGELDGRELHLSLKRV